MTQTCHTGDDEFRKRLTGEAANGKVDDESSAFKLYGQVPRTSNPAEVGRQQSPNEGSLNDSALVDGLRRQDPAAVRYLSETCLPSVWRFAFVRVKGNRHLAEDIVSEAVLALLRTVQDPEAGIANPISWLRTVVANKVTDHFRAAARVRHLIQQVQQSAPPPPGDSVLEEQQREEEREEIRGIIETLPEQVRIALEWKYIDKVSVRDISERLGMTEKAVESILFRGRREFRERVEKLRKSQDRPRPALTAPPDREPEPIEQVTEKRDRLSRAIIPDG